MAGRQRYTAAQVIAALHATKGMVFLAAKRLGCDYDTVLNYCKRYPTVQAAKDAERGEMVDTAELKLWQAIQNGQPWAIALALRMLGKERGYMEKAQLDIEGDVHLHLAERTRQANERIARLRRLPSAGADRADTG